MCYLPFLFNWMWNILAISEWKLFLLQIFVSVMRRRKQRVAPEGDGIRVWIFSLSDEEGSISRDPHEIVLRLTSTQVTVKPPRDKKTTVSHVRCICRHSRALKEAVHVGFYSPAGWDVVNTMKFVCACQVSTYPSCRCWSGRGTHSVRRRLKSWQRRGFSL